MEKKERTINHNYIKQLYTILNEEYELYKEIAQVEKEKNGLLMKGVFIDLEPINVKLSHLVRRSANMEQKRTFISNFVTKELGLPLSSSLKRIISSVPDNYKEKLNNIYEKFIMILADIKKYNDINSKLISDTLRVIDVTLNAYVNEEQTMEINYGNHINGKNKNRNTYNNPKFFNRSV
ncbi:MAG: flagellar protein FlgN [Spirochaetota bacterium]